MYAVALVSTSVRFKTFNRNVTSSDLYDDCSTLSKDCHGDSFRYLLRESSLSVRLLASSCKSVCRQQRNRLHASTKIDDSITIRRMCPMTKKRITLFLQATKHAFIETMYFKITSI